MPQRDPSLTWLSEAAATERPASDTLRGMVPFDATLDAQPTHAVIRVSGELDIATTPLLQVVISKAQTADRPVIVDVSDTSFCDSTGMSAVLRAHKHAEARGLPFVLVCPEENREVTRVLVLLGFDEVFAVQSSLAEAVRQVAGAEPS